MADAFLPDAKSLYLQFCTKDGDLGVEELALALQCLGTSALGPEQLVTMLTQLDVDGDGVVSQEDFVLSMTPFIDALKTKVACEPPSPQPDDRRISSSIKDHTLETFEYRFEDALSKLPTPPAEPVEAVKKLVLGEMETLGVRLSEVQEAAQREQQRLTQLNEQLALECHRMEAELNESADSKLRSNETSVENNRLRALVAELNADLHKQSGGEKTQKEHISTLNAEVGTLQKQRSDLALKFQALEDHTQSLESENQTLSLELLQLQDEHSRVSLELARLNESQQQGQDVLQSLGAESSVKAQEVVQLQAELHEIQEAVEMKDAEIQGLREDLNEQRMLLASLSGGKSGPTGSVLNEIEDLVMFQLQEEHQDNNDTTISMLQQLLPRLEETRLTSNGDGLVAQTFSGVSPRRRRRRKRRDGAVSAPVTPRKSPAEADVIQVSAHAFTPQSPPGALLGSHQITPTQTESLAPVVPQPTTPLQPDSAVDMESSESPQKTDGSDEEEGNAVDDKLNQVLRLYAASTQHLVGVKIITPEMAAQMDVESLQQMKQTLGDLVAARNKLLLKVLNERDTLRNEIHLKQTVLKPVIDLVLAVNLESHPASQPGTPTVLSGPLTPLQTPHSRFGSLGRRRSSRTPESASSAPMSGPRKFMSSLGKLLTPNSDRKDGHEVKV
eukprot:m.166647 g.166647  ORF g.166647 m.166647 type:complete len:672 (+) comp16627_c0_seq2:120-2135(+)